MVNRDRDRGRPGEGSARSRSAAQEPDPATLDACRGGDRSALERVLLGHAPMLERLLARLCGPTLDVQDVLWQTFAEAIVAFPRFRGDARVSTWLCSIAVNLVRQSLRSPHRRALVPLELVPDAAAPVDGALPADRRAGTRRLLERLYEHLDAIAPAKRVAFILHALDERPIQEVAALMGATCAATKSRVFWARRELARRLHRDPVCRELLARKEAAR